MSLTVDESEQSIHRRVFFIPGLWEGSEYLSRVIPNEYYTRLHVVDLPQYSMAPRLSFRYSDDLEHVARHIRAASSCPVIIISHSYGAQIALGLLEKGVRVAKFVHIGPMLGRWWVLQALYNIVLMPFSGALPWWVKRIMGSRKPLVTDRYADIPTKDLLPPSFLAGVSQIIAVMGTAGHGRNVDTAISTLLLRGSDDPFTPRLSSTTPEELVWAYADHTGLLNSHALWDHVFTWLEKT